MFIVLITWILLQQVILRLKIVLPNRVDFRTGHALGTIATGLHPLGHCALTYLTQRAAEKGLGAVHAASLAIDMFRKDGRMVQLRPEFSGSFPQRLIIVLCGNIGVALLAVKPTDASQSFHFSRPGYPESTAITPSENRVNNLNIKFAIRLKL